MNAPAPASEIEKAMERVQSVLSLGANARSADYCLPADNGRFNTLPSDADYLARYVQALAARVTALEEGLRPFALAADEYDDDEDDTFSIWIDANASVVMKDVFALKHYRAARALLGKARPIRALIAPPAEAREGSDG